ncbi:MAG TPA: ATP-binding protein [Candidatus Binataceae bacterium]|nr:ATP-binding protein [Candidatus Binataceae bacterium]
MLEFLYNGRVTIGRRLVFVLLLTLTPVIAVYTYWCVQWSRQNYIVDLRREMRATMRGIAPVLAGYARQGKSAEINELFRRMSADGSEWALLQGNGKVWYASTDFPRALIPTALHSAVGAEGFEFEQAVANHYWFCRIRAMHGSEPTGYILVAQEWSDISENLRQRMLPSVGAALIVIALIGALIPVLVNRYVSRPLADLSRKVVRFSEGEPAGGGENEMELISEEFQRLDQQLTKARADLLERHRYERELDLRLQRADRLATIGTLASGLAHEIGTPMSVIRTRAELLLQGSQSPEKISESLMIVVGQIERISKIVRMLLDYARTRESSRGKHDVRALLEHILKLVESEANRKRVQIIAELGDQPLTVGCDPDQLQQVFVNLAVNAFDAMAPAGGRLLVSSDIDLTDHHHELKVVFEDSGPGVPPELRKQLFDPFFTTKPPGKGTGMGLAVSQAIMRDHGGDILYESTPAGARFSVIMPAENRGAEQRARNMEGAQA